MDTTRSEPQHAPFLDLVCAVAALAELWDREADAAGDVCRVPAVPPMVLDAARMHHYPPDADGSPSIAEVRQLDVVRDVDVAALELFTHAPASWRRDVSGRSYVRGSGLSRQLLGVLAGDRLPSLGDAPLAFVTTLDCRDADLYSPSELAGCARAALRAVCSCDGGVSTAGYGLAAHTALEVFARTHDTADGTVDADVPCSCGSASRRNTRCLACATRAIVTAQRLGCVPAGGGNVRIICLWRELLELREVAEGMFARMQQQEPWACLAAVEFGAVWSHLICAVALACCKNYLSFALHRATEYRDPLVLHVAVELATALEPDAAAAGLSRRDADVPAAKWAPGRACTPMDLLAAARLQISLRAPVRAATYTFDASWPTVLRRVRADATGAYMDRAGWPAAPPTARCNVVRRAARALQRDAARPTLRRLKRDPTAAPTPRQRHRGR